MTKECFFFSRVVEMHVCVDSFPYTVRDRNWMESIFVIVTWYINQVQIILKRRFVVRSWSFVVQCRRFKIHWNLFKMCDDDVAALVVDNGVWLSVFVYFIVFFFQTINLIRWANGLSCEYLIVKMNWVKFSKPKKLKKKIKALQWEMKKKKPNNKALLLQ